ncbi:MAG TPA: hypothetical protein VD794_04180 [Flavisolibacter sp.]|nr:hypothetical protein [Flavisolibacter sp.]
MQNYQVKKATHLLPNEINLILSTWDVKEWNSLSVTDFRNQFFSSEFHLLLDNSYSIVSFARINFDFKLQIEDQAYSIPEFVGFISVRKGKGYGSMLLENIITNLRARNIEALGFCEKTLRPFYEKCAVPILYNQARFIKEPMNNEWQISDDDDILNLTLSTRTSKLLMSLNDERSAFLTI